MTLKLPCELLQINKDSLFIRDMQPSDLSEVLAMEINAQASPWGRISFEESLAREHICRVVIDSKQLQNTILAFHVICPVADELHILNLVVSTSYQGQGIAHVLMQDIITTAQNSNQIKKVFLEVRAGNTVAQNLYRQWQFEQIAFRKNYYRTPTLDEREDALVLVRRI